MTVHASFPVRVWRRLDREEDDAAREREMEQEFHRSVLTAEVLELLDPRDGMSVLDATAGAGGHSEALLKHARVRLVALDADPVAVSAVMRRLARYGERVLVLEANFADLEAALARAGVESLDRALFDLGWRREQLGLGRGFSFEGNEPLEMSYGKRPRSGFTAAEVLNRWSEEALSNVFFGYGGERYARRIAKAIVQARKEAPISTTAELVALIGDAVPAAYRRGRAHFATKVFQALRVAVNDELRALEEGVRAAWKLLAPGGRLAVISFHSIEDRAVKNLFREFSQGEGSILTKKPRTAGLSERRENPSARSAKLRAIEKAAS